MLGYKIVQRYEGRYYSWYLRDRGVEYFINEWTEAPVNKIIPEFLLFIFRDLETAKCEPHLRGISEYNSYKDLELWEIEYEGLVISKLAPKLCNNMAQRVKLIRNIM